MPLSRRYLPHHRDYLKSVLTESAHFRLHRTAICISSQQLTGSLGSQSRCLWEEQWLWLCGRPGCWTSLPVWSKGGLNLQLWIPVHIEGLTGFVFRRLGIKHHLTAALHPQANGLVERFHPPSQRRPQSKTRPRQTGWLTYPGYCYVRGQRLRKAPAFHCLENSSTTRSWATDARSWSQKPLWSHPVDPTSVQSTGGCCTRHHSFCCEDGHTCVCTEGGSANSLWSPSTRVLPWWWKGSRIFSWWASVPPENPSLWPDWRHNWVQLQRFYGGKADLHW